MEKKYSKKEFLDYTHRFVVQFETGEPHHSTLQIYSNSDSYKELDDFINEKKSTKVVSFTIVHRASKEQDEMTSKLMSEFFALDATKEVNHA